MIRNINKIKAFLLIHTRVLPFAITKKIQFSFLVISSRFISPLWREIQTARRPVLQEVCNASSQVVVLILPRKSTNSLTMLSFIT